MRLALIVAACLLASPAWAGPTTISPNRANAAVSGAPNVMVTAAGGQNDLCTGVVSAAYGSPMLAVTFDVQRADKACARIRKVKAMQGLADQLVQLGRPAPAFDLVAGAVQLMCGDPEVAEAMRKANRPCQLEATP